MKSSLGGVITKNFWLNNDQRTKKKLMTQNSVKQVIFAAL
jgi:hypothetical protein